jgi:hypothetical protein
MDIEKNNRLSHFLFWRGNLLCRLCAKGSTRWIQHKFSVFEIYGLDDVCEKEDLFSTNTSVPNVFRLFIFLRFRCNKVNTRISVDFKNTPRSSHIRTVNKHLQPTRSIYHCMQCAVLAFGEYLIQNSDFWRVSFRTYVPQPPLHCTLFTHWKVQETGNQPDFLMEYRVHSPNPHGGCSSNTHHHHLLPKITIVMIEKSSHHR